jgi:DNA-binding transcriptional MerR regulator
MENAADRKLLKIGAVARLTGITVHTLRNWEEHHGAVQPRRSPGGKRLYSEADVQRLSLIKRLADEGLSLHEIAACSFDELAEHWERLSGAETPVTTSEPVQAAILGTGLASWLQSQPEQLAGMEIVAAADDVNELARRLGKSPVDVLLVECPAITGSTAREVRNYVQLLGVRSSVVVYWFGHPQHIDELKSLRIDVLRAPAEPLALQRLVARSGAGRAAPVPVSSGRTVDFNTPAPPRLSRKSLVAMASANPRASCGCQKNLVDVVLSLRALEEYLNGCENRSPEDEALHKALWRKVGEARSKIEDAIEHFAAVEGIEL